LLQAIIRLLGLKGSAQAQHTGEHKANHSSPGQAGWYSPLWFRLKWNKV
jgi:hypothetical protein